MTPLFNNENQGRHHLEGFIVRIFSTSNPLRKFAQNFLPTIYEKILRQKWKSAFNQYSEDPVRFSKPPESLNVINIGRFSYSADTINVHHVSSKTKISIGNYVSIGLNLKFITSGGHAPENISTYPFPRNSLYENGDIFIGNDAWIGDDVTVMGGVKIGDGCIVGTGSIVTRDLEPFCIYAGVPAKLVRRRFPKEYAERIIACRWWDIEPQYIVQVEKILSSEISEDSLLTLETFVKNLNKIIPEEIKNNEVYALSKIIDINNIT